jgi:hypothetical protein
MLIVGTIVVVVALTGSYVTYTWLQARAMGGLQDLVRIFTGKWQPPTDPKIERFNAAIRKRFERLTPSSALRDWLILLNEDTHSHVLDAAQPAIRMRPKLGAELDELLDSKSSTDRALALRWSGLRPVLDPSSARRIHAVLLDLAERLASSRGRGQAHADESELFAGAMACQTLQEAGVADVSVLRRLRDEIQRLGDPTRLGYIVGTIDSALEHLPNRN